MKIIVIMTLVYLDGLMVGITTTCIHRQNHTLMTVTTSTIDRSVSATPEAVPTPEDAPDPTPLWRVMIRTVAE